MLDSLGQALEAQGRHAEAEKACRQAIESQRTAITKSPDSVESRKLLSSHYTGLVRALRAQGRAAEGVQVARQNRASCKGNPDALFHAACGLALCIPIGRDRPEYRTLVAEAVNTLHAAVSAGWSNAQKIGRDPDLAALHDRDEFRRLVAELFDRGFPSDPFAK